ncbi:MAG: L-rhamnose mutarotase [Actinobacteria bacterium]|nr:L-rhamnose mutarotase [Actinomycetota bacterium]
MQSENNSKDVKTNIKRYLMVLEIDPDHLKEYIDIHKNPWPELLESIKSEGANELLIWNYKNLSIVYYETEDIDAIYKRLASHEVQKKWNLKVGPWIKVSPPLDGSGKVNTCEKIFDLNQQIAGKLELF